MIHRRPLFLVSAAALMVLGAYYIPFAWPLSFVALVPLFYAVHRAHSIGHAFWLGTLAGLFIVGGTAGWMFQVRPLPFLEHALLLNYTAIFFSWCVITFSMAPLMGIWAVVVRTVQVNRVANVGFAAAFFVVCEYARLFSFSLATHAPGIHNPPFFSIGFIGYPLADSLSWLQLASMGGVYALSFVVVMVNAVFFYLLHVKSVSLRRIGFASVILALFIFSVLPVADIREGGVRAIKSEVRIGMMALYPPEDPERRKEEAAYQELVAAAIQETVAKDASVVLLPEGARFFSRNTWKLEEGAGGPVVIDSDVRPAPGGNALGAIGKNISTGSTTLLREKAILTPQGEYLITAFTSIVVPAGFGEEVAKAERELGLVNGANDAVLHHESIDGAVIFCVEIFTPGLAKSLVSNKGANIIFAALSYARFYESYTLQRDTLRLLKVQAVEAGVPLVSSAYSTAGYAIDSFGRIMRTIGASGRSEADVVSVSLFLR